MVSDRLDQEALVLAKLAEKEKTKKIEEPLPAILYVCGHGRVRIDDVDYGSSLYDGGNGAVIGVQSNDSTGLAWSCTGGLSSGTSAWFGTVWPTP